ncbi:LysM repeat protein [Peribacillus deserti]|uniref:LysM repeat protein n=1 Tax=Peribacillus deserti TaxID=673318 RepID=A0ABS2QL64_9BACI|nr:LysM peptidoglycan-binding domain-containing protein [Peribacillus deserti]MBM7693750.1 LysM repeat protein [Peribacillus deserti]
MISKKGLAASFLATSLLFSGVGAVLSEITTASAAQVSPYQTELNTFAAHYAKIFRTVEGYTKQLDGAKSESQAIKIHDQYMTYFSSALDDDAKFAKYNAEIQNLDEFIYNSLVEMYNFEIDTIDYMNGDLSKADYDKSYNSMTKFVDSQDALFKKAAASYKAKYKITFSNDMLYLLDGEQQDTIRTVTYTVKKGDNLYRIAIKYKTSVDALKKLNHLKSSSLKIGQKLKVPVTSNPAATPASYKVKKGDTLYSISKTARLSVAELKKLNNLKSDSIYVGQVLKFKK